MGHGQAVAYDELNDRLLIVHDGAMASTGRSEAAPARPPSNRQALARIGAGLRGMAVDPVTGTGYALDRARRRVEVLPVGDGAEGQVGVPAPSGDLAGLALGPTDGELYVYAADREELVAFEPSGTAGATYDLSGVGLRDVQAMVFAPSSDPTDDPASMNLFIADGAVGSLLGTVVEVSLTAAPVAGSADATTLVATVDTSRLQPPSPDPSGITWMGATGRLLVSDSEVNEMPLFERVNLYTLTRTGTLTATGLTTRYTREPTGLSLDAASGQLFMSDDNLKVVHVVRAGSDGRFGTKDDVATRVDTRVFGSGDPEGVEYVPQDGRLYVLDGVGREVYVVDPVNGVFGDAGDVVTHFDVAAFGAVDPEGLGWDAARQVLVVLDGTSRRFYEVTTGGQLVGALDLPAGLPTSTKAAGVTLAPTTQPGGGDAYWVVDRGVDNDVDPSENDGHVFEIVRATDGPRPPTVVLTAPSDGGHVQGVVDLAADVVDDGVVVGVEFTVDGVSVGVDANGGDGWGVAWDSSTVADGTHEVAATATDDDGERAGDAVSVTVANQPGGTVEVTIADGWDDVEELVSGSIVSTSTDLDLMTDRGTAQAAVGLRFPGVQVPAGAVVREAYVQFQADEKDTAVTSLQVRAEDVDDAAPFTGQAGAVTSRVRTAAAVAWQPVAWRTVGERGAAQRTPDLAGVVQHVVDRSGWSPGNAMVLIVTGTGERIAESSEGSGAPTLLIRYEAGDPSGGGGGTSVSVDEPAGGAVVSGDVPVLATAGPDVGSVTFLADGAEIGTDTDGSNGWQVVWATTAVADGAHTLRAEARGPAGDVVTSPGVSVTVANQPGGTVEVTIADGWDDVEELVSGSIVSTSTDLDLMTDRGTAQAAVGLRFPGVQVPAGAVVREAYVQFQADEKDTAVTSLQVRAEDVDDAAPFTGQAGAVTSRVRTAAAVAWQPVAWRIVGERGAAQRTPDLAGVVQHVVDRSGWSPGNAMVLIVTGTGERIAESSEGTGAPTLLIRYE